jgi:hypothetical protein
MPITVTPPLNPCLSSDLLEDVSVARCGAETMKEKEKNEGKDLKERKKRLEL